MRVGEPRLLLDLRLGCVRAPITDVLGERAVEQHRLLRHDSDLPPQRCLRRVPHVLTIDRHPAGVHVVQPLDQLHEAGLPRSRWSDQPDALPGGNGDR